ncbi:hypothetical protein [uncultured Jannaschia sp.]|uniref:hypothetical protein n=1 Tax=uncultured Jannaschia sp. TaxID=293347 RepID=UPI00260E64E4|nr:hypothetical protein [uncultured Jannaschia sp.]
MSRPTLSDLRLELAATLIVQAKHIVLATDSPEQGEAFLGCDPEDTRAEAVDLSRFPIAAEIEALHAYAFTPTGDDLYDVNALHGMAHFLSSLPREDWDGSVHGFPSQGSPFAMSDVLEAASARAALDGQDGTWTDQLSTRQLALLADITEGAVRNALSQGGAAGLTAIPGAKPVRVSLDEARRWLPGRRGFRPTPTGPSDDPVMTERLRGFDRMEQLTDLVGRHAARRLGSAEALGTDAAGWLDGSYTFDTTAACRVAKAIGADAPTFVGKALELALRRDSEGLA